MTRRGVLAGALVLATLLTLAACGSGRHPQASGPVAPAPSPGSSTIAGEPVTTGQPCGQNVAAPSYDHVVWIWMENHTYSSIIGSSDAPYENSLAQLCGLATNYHSITHPSLPNYLAATGGSTAGVTDDNDPSSHPIAGPSVFAQAAQLAAGWRSYEEAMPRPCERRDSGRYAVRHDPAAYYVSLGGSCTAFDIPMGPIDSGALHRDLQARTLPAFSFVTPDVCNDTHDCNVRTGDEWLSKLLPTIFSSPTYGDRHTAIFITWDEGESDDHVATLVMAPSVPAGTRSAAFFDHYSLLRTAEDLLGLAPLGKAATTSSMMGAFHL